jgi:hypothetical protein
VAEKSIDRLWSDFVYGLDASRAVAQLIKLTYPSGTIPQSGVFVLSDSDSNIVALVCFS